MNGEQDVEGKRPLLVILPGLDGMGELTDPLVEVMPKDCEVLQFSYPVDPPLSIDQLVDFVEERLPFNRPLFLLAHSFSGPIAAKVLAREGRDYRGAFFYATFITSPRPILLRIARYLPLATIFRFTVQDALLRFLFLDKASPDSLVEALQQVRRKVPPSILAYRLRDLSKVDARDALRRLRIPCLYVRAGQDLLIPRSAIKPFCDSLSGLEVRTIDAPHALLMTDPKESWEVIRQRVLGE